MIEGLTIDTSVEEVKVARPILYESSIDSILFHLAGRRTSIIVTTPNPYKSSN